MYKRQTLTQVAYSQKAVLDITCMETLIANHKVQHTSFSKVKENEAQDVYKRQLYLNTGKRLHHKRNDTDTIQELSPISKRIASN